MRVLILIPTYRRAEHLKRTLDSIKSNLYEKIKIDVLIIFNGGDRETAEILVDFQRYKDLFGLKVVEGKDSYFWSRSIRLGLRNLDHAHYSHFVFMNDDVTLSEKFFSELFNQVIINDQVILTASVMQGKDELTASSLLGVDFHRLKIQPLLSSVGVGSAAASTRFTIFPTDACNNRNKIPLGLLPHYYADILFTLNLNLQGYKISSLEKAFVYSNLENKLLNKSYLFKRFNKRSPENYFALITFWVFAYIYKIIYKRN